VSGARYVLLGLAPPRAIWFRDVAQWANTGVIQAEFVKCLSAEEVRARLSSGRPFSALLIDATLPSLDRDLVDAARADGCAVLVVDDPRRARDWTTVGASATLAAPFDRKQLLDVLTGHVSLIGSADRIVDGPGAPTGRGWRAPLVAVTGPGGTGASTIAIAIAQGLAADVRAAGAVLLADLRLNAEMAMLHDARDTVPGIQEVVEACRSTRPAADDLRRLTFGVPDRGYRLLLGLRQARAWSTIRPRAFESAVDALRTAFQAVVVDVDADVEGEEDGGSIDVEERNLMARTTLPAAETVVVVGAPGMKGIHSLTRVIGSLVAHAVDISRIVPVINRAPRGMRARSEMGGALASLVPSPALQPALFIGERHVDAALRDMAPLPDALVGPLVDRCTAITARPQAAVDHPRPVTPGSLGRWTPELEPR